MPAASRIERHFTAAATVRNIISGTFDGLVGRLAVVSANSGEIDFSLGYLKKNWRDSYQSPL